MTKIKGIKDKNLNLFLDHLIKMFVVQSKRCIHDRGEMMQFNIIPSVWNSDCPNKYWSWGEIKEFVNKMIEFGDEEKTYMLKWEKGNK